MSEGKITRLIKMTFGGMSMGLYIRHFLFGLAIFGFFLAIDRENVMPESMVVFLAISTLLYPYSRYAYESVVNYIVGDHIIFTSILILIPVKLFTIAMCWSLAVFIAPVGWLFLFLKNLGEAQQP